VAALGSAPGDAAALSGDGAAGFFAALWRQHERGGRADGEANGKTGREDDRPLVRGLEPPKGGPFAA
jgi:hypothetical protein